MSLSRITVLALSIVALAASLALWYFGGGLLRVLEVLTVRPGSPVPASVPHSLYASLAGMAFAVSLAGAIGAIVVAARDRALAVPGRILLGLAGLAMFVGGGVVAWSLHQAVRALNIIATSEVQIKPEEFEAAAAESLPFLQFGLALLCVSSLGLVLCGLLGWGPRNSAASRAPIAWAFLVPAIAVGVLLALIFAGAIPAAIQLAEFFDPSNSQSIRPSDVVQALGRVLSSGQMVGVMFLIYGVVVISLAFLPSAKSNTLAATEPRPR